MTLSNFRLNVVLRVLLLCILIGTLISVVYKTSWVVTPLVIGIIAWIVIVDLVLYVEKGNKEFTDFLLSIKNSDFSKYNAADKRGGSFVELKKAYNTIIDEFQSTRIDKESQYTFLQTALEHLNTAIICFDRTGEVKLINEEAKILLHSPYLFNINILQKANPTLYERLQGNTNEVLEIDINGEHLKLLFRSTAFKLQNVEHKLISIQNIKTEIEQKEIEAWEQLLRVLTHEIMNSITPISSLSATLKEKMDAIPATTANTESLDDVKQGLDVIENRSNGLVSFVHHYKSLITLPAPDFKQVSVKQVFERARLLTEKQLEEKGIAIDFDIKNDFMIQLDINLVEQVLINLINNSADALSTTAEPLIVLSASRFNNKTVIRIADNGQGIDKEMLSRVFIPFFSTKKKGSGIGLSLSKQIMHLHGGSINVNSEPHVGTVFNLEFPAVGN